MAQTENTPKRDAGAVLREIEAKLATLDGVAIADAFQFGALVREYGELRSADGARSIFAPLFESLKKRPEPGESWRETL